LCNIIAELVSRNQGLNVAVAHMHVGEKSVVEVGPEYGFGEKGSFSFPSVKPNAALVYELELVAASPPEDKRKQDMFFEERLEAAQRLRLQVPLPKPSQVVSICTMCMNSLSGIAGQDEHEYSGCRR
jgi:hypothetical protein